jgi:hypothetical protein
VEVVAGEDVEDLDEDEAAGGWRRRGDDLVTAIVSYNGGAVFDFVSGEVGGGDEAAVGLLEGGDLLRHFSLVEVVGVGGDAGEGGGQLGLAEGVAFFVEVAVTLEDAGGGGELGEGFVVEIIGFRSGEDEAVGGEGDGGGHVLLEGELAEVLLRVDEAGYGAGDAAGLVADGGEVGDDVFFGVEIHVGGGGGGGLLAVVEEVSLAVACADEHESSAADVASLGMDDGEGEAYGYGGVDGVASLLEDGEASVGGVVVDGDDHRVPGADGLVGLGGEGRGSERKRDQECGDAG